MKDTLKYIATQTPMVLGTICALCSLTLGADSSICTQFNILSEQEQLFIRIGLLSTSFVLAYLGNVIGKKLGLLT